ncbi:hypothetical protein, partial [Enterobacter intestinihominis]
EEPNLKSLLLKQAFCFSAFGKFVGWPSAYPTYGPLGPVSATPPGIPTINGIPDPDSKTQLRAHETSIRIG